MIVDASDVASDGGESFCSLEVTPESVTAEPLPAAEAEEEGNSSGDEAATGDVDDLEYVALDLVNVLPATQLSRLLNLLRVRPLGAAAGGLQAGAAEASELKRENKELRREVRNLRKQAAQNRVQTTPSEVKASKVEAVEKGGATVTAAVGCSGDGVVALEGSKQAVTDDRTRLQADLEKRVAEMAAEKRGEVRNPFGEDLREAAAETLEFFKDAKRASEELPRLVATLVQWLIWATRPDLGHLGASELLTRVPEKTLQHAYRTALELVETQAGQASSRNLTGLPECSPRALLTVDAPSADAHVQRVGLACLALSALSPSTRQAMLEAMPDEKGVGNTVGGRGELATLSTAETAIPEEPPGGDPVIASDTGEQPRTPRPPEPSHVPQRIVAQVLSLNAGSVRLSWLFDWAVAPSHLVSAAGVVQGYRIRQRREAGADGDLEELLHCERAALNLQLPVGHRYSFEVQALLADSRRTRDPSSVPSLHEAHPSLASLLGSAGSETVLWTSASSSTVVADLRGALGAALPTRNPPVSVSLALPGRTAPVSATAVAASPSTGEVPAAGVNGAEPGSVSLPTGAPGRSTVAASLGNFLAMQPRQGVSTVRAPFFFAPPLRGAAPAGPDMDGADDGDKEPQQMALVADPHSNPLASSQPRVVTAGPLDPDTEKREVAGRLLLRRGQPTIPREEATLKEKLRKLSTDSDDDEESLMKLSSALSSLERTAASRKQTAVKCVDHRVAQEGHHGLHERLEQPPPPWKVPGHRAGGVVSAAACTPKNRSASEGDVYGGDEEVPRERSFRLKVHTDGKTPVLEFNPGDDLVSLVPAFLKDHGIRETLKEPLLCRARILLNSGRQEDGVDIVDLV